MVQMSASRLLRFQFGLWLPVPPEPAPTVIGLVHGDPVNPGLQAAFSSKLVHAAENLEEDFLRYIARLVVILDEALHQAEDRLLKMRD
jgi:hypothetical protein